MDEEQTARGHQVVAVCRTAGDIQADAADPEQTARVFAEVGAGWTDPGEDRDVGVPGRVRRVQAGGATHLRRAGRPAQPTDPSPQAQEDPCPSRAC